MPFYRSPDDDVELVEDLAIGIGRMMADNKTKRFVSIMSEGHIFGMDLEELTLILHDLTRAHAELQDLCKADERKKASPEDDLQTTQFRSQKAVLN